MDTVPCKLHRTEMVKKYVVMIMRKRNTAVALEAQVEIMALLTAVSGVVYFFLNQQLV